MNSKGSFIRITESPRDAQQGLSYIIPADKRAAYINALMRANFDVIDFGSFVSSRAVPQMADQSEVLRLIDKGESDTKLMAIVGNSRGGREAVAQEKVNIIGFPYSLSETFMKRNINSTIFKALETVSYITDIAGVTGKEVRIFLSMAFGNPYGDEWSIDEMKAHIGKFIEMGIKTITLSDTIGIATPQSIGEIFKTMISTWPDIEFGLHLHTKPDGWYEKLQAAWDNGCYSFDGVINGIGGCPMTGYDLIGNLNTMNIIKFAKDKNIPLAIDENAINEALAVASEIYDVELKEVEFLNKPHK